MKILSLMLLFINMQYESSAVNFFKIFVVGAMMFMGMNGEVSKSSSTGLQKFNKPTGLIGIHTMNSDEGDDDNELAHPFSEIPNTGQIASVNSSEIKADMNHMQENQQQEEVWEPAKDKWEEEDDNDFESFEGENEKEARLAEMELLVQENHPINNMMENEVNVPSNVVQVVEPSSSNSVAEVIQQIQEPKIEQASEVAEAIVQENKNNEQKENQKDSSSSKWTWSGIAAAMLLAMNKEKVKKMLESIKVIAGSLLNIINTIWKYKTQIIIVLSLILLIILMRYILSILPILFFFSIVGTTSYLYFVKKQTLTDLISMMRENFIKFSSYFKNYFKVK